MTDEEASTPLGLLRCLRLLADEASTMRLTRTLAALQQAMETCRTESVIHSHHRSSALH